jgi:hypothetical protein
VEIGQLLELRHLGILGSSGRSRSVLLGRGSRRGCSLLLLVRLRLSLLGVLLLLMVGDGAGGPGDDCGRGGGPDEATSASHHRE